MATALFQRVLAIAASHSLLNARRVRRVWRLIMVRPLDLLPPTSHSVGHSVASFAAIMRFCRSRTVLIRAL